MDEKHKELFKAAQLIEYEKTVQHLKEEKVDFCIVLMSRGHMMLILQLKITESMRKREELMNQKTELISTNETVEKDLMVCLQPYLHCVVYFLITMDIYSTRIFICKRSSIVFSIFVKVQ